MTKIFTPAENQAWANTLPGKMCSACLVLCAGDKVLMVKASYKDYWTFPGGIVDEGESPSHAAVRETFEEVGITVQSDNIKLLKVVYTGGKDGYRDRFNFAYVTQFDETDTLLSVPNDEIEEARWVNISEVAELANKGSYVQFQNILSNPSLSEIYTEI